VYDEHTCPHAYAREPLCAHAHRDDNGCGDGPDDGGNVGGGHGGHSGHGGILVGHGDGADDRTGGGGICDGGGVKEI
jgi:hypothetical protein